MTTKPAVEALGVEKAYGDVRVLAGVDLAAAPGTVFGLLGPNGAGKTTLVRILSTLTRADRGTARVAGLDVVSDRAGVRRRISLTGQYAAVDELQTGAEMLRMMGRLVGLSGSATRTRAGELLGRFDLESAAGRLIKTYSGGMRRRLDLAAGLVGTPAVIFLDEPTTGLDLSGRQAMWQVIGDLADTGVTVFLTTQYLEEADRLADHIAVLDAGRVVAEGSAASLKARVAEQRLDLTATSPGAYGEVVARLGDRAIAPDATRRAVSVATDGGAGHIRALLDEIDPGRTLVERFGVHVATLDDVFLALTGTSAAKEPAHV